MPAQPAAPAAAAPSLQSLSDRVPELVEQWRIILKRKVGIAALAATITFLTAIVVYMITPVYRATATVLIEASKSKVVSVEEVYAGVGGNREHFQTQAEIIKSREVARRVVQKLKLADNPEFDPRRPAEGMARLTGMFRGSPGEASQEDLEKAVALNVMSRINVEPVRQSQLIRVSFDSTDPALAALAANTVVDAYIEHDFDARFRMTQQASEWLNERLADLKVKLDQSEKALQGYREREGLVDSKGVALGGATKTLEEASQKLVEAKRRRSEAQFAYELVRKGPAYYDQVPEIGRNTAVQRAKETYNDAERRMSEMNERYGKEHPRMVAAESEFKAAKDNLNRVMETAAQQVTKEYESARASENALESAATGARGQIKDINRKEIELSSFEREAQTNRQLYQTFLSRFKETTATNDVQQAVARLIDKAVPPSIPIKPQRKDAILSALVVGLLLGVVAALLIERLDNTIKSTDTAEAKLQLPLITTLPKIDLKPGVRAGRMMLDEPRGIFSEAIRTARTAVQLSSVDIQHKILAITSSVPEEGKSTFSMNFALSNAHLKKTLLIDADMRRPTVAKTLSLPPSQPGLSELVAGTAEPDDCIYKVPDSDLCVISAGKIPPNPLDLLVSLRFRDTLAQLQKRFELIVIDTPPTNLVSDASVIAQQVTSVLFVVKAESTPIPVVRRAIKTLRAAKAPLVGFVINSLDYKRAQRYYGEYAAYGYTKFGDGYVAYGEDPQSAGASESSSESSEPRRRRRRSVAAAAESASTASTATVQTSSLNDTRP